MEERNGQDAGLGKERIGVAFFCRMCERSFGSEHDVEWVIDQDTNKGYHVCHDCLIVGARPRRWMMKANMRLKTQAIERKREELGRMKPEEEFKRWLEETAKNPIVAEYMASHGVKVGDAVLRLRCRGEFTQWELAEQLGIKVELVQHLEGGFLQESKISKIMARIEETKEGFYKKLLEDEEAALQAVRQNSEGSK